MNLDSLYAKTYHAQDYNCAHFVCDVWRALTGRDITEIMQGFLLPARTARQSLRRDLKILRLPESPCIALMTSSVADPHVGIYLNRKIIDITSVGVRMTPVDVASVLHQRIGYYQCRR